MTAAAWIGLVAAIVGGSGLTGLLTYLSQRKREPVAVGNLMLEGAQVAVALQTDVLTAARQDIARLYEQVQAERATREREVEVLWQRLTGAYSYVEALRDHILQQAPPPPPPYPADWQAPGPWSMPTPTSIIEQPIPRPRPKEF